MRRVGRFDAGAGADVVELRVAPVSGLVLSVPLLFPDPVDLLLRYRRPDTVLRCPKS